MSNAESSHVSPGGIILVKSFFLKTIKILLWLIGILVFLISVYYAHSFYRKYQQLTFMTDDSCDWHEGRLQLCKTPEGDLYLRTVDMSERRLSISKIIDRASFDSEKYAYELYWLYDCEDGLEIDTGEVFSGGEPQKLICDSGPSKYLGVSAPHRLKFSYAYGKQNDVIFDSHGFSMNHYYERKDFSPLLRRHALTSSEIKIKRAERLQREAEEIENKKRERRELEVLECEKDFEAQSSSLKRRVAAENAKLSGTNYVSIICNRFTASNYCSSYGLKIENASEFAIRRLKVGRGTDGFCRSNIYSTTIVEGPIQSGSDFYENWRSFQDSADYNCATILSVEFDVAPVKNNCQTVSSGND